MLFNGVRDDVIYRQLIMRRPPNNGVGYIIDLAEIIIPGGVIRVDRCRMAFEHELTLGNFGLPHVEGKPAVVNQFQDGNRKVITAMIPGRKVALITYQAGQGYVVWSMKEELRKQKKVRLYWVSETDLKKSPIDLMISVMLHSRAG